MTIYNLGLTKKFIQFLPVANCITTKRFFFFKNVIVILFKINTLAYILIIDRNVLTFI